MISEWEYSINNVTRNHGFIYLEMYLLMIRIGVPFTDLTPPHHFVYPKLEPYFSRHLVFFISSDFQCC